MSLLQWHSGLVIYLFAALTLVVGGYLLHRTGRLKNSWVQKIYLVVAGVLGGILLSEAWLRTEHRYTTYSEDREGVFVNPGERLQPTWYMVYPPRQQIILSSGNEYSFPRTTNSEGLSDEEWTTAKDSNEIRIMTLGDSFTEGDGAPYDSSYPKILEKLLQQQHPQAKINVMNAGRCGSDPFFEYKKLHDRLLKYKPDLVVYTNGSNDLLYDHLCYGGMERFAADSTIQNKFPHYWWLPLFRVSYIFRAIVFEAGFDVSLFHRKFIADDEKVAIRDAQQLNKLYHQLGNENGFRCIQILRPEKPEIKNGRYDFDREKLVLSNRDTMYCATFDLLQFYSDSLQMDKQNVVNFFWQVDGHHNSEGYAAMARGINHFIRPLVAEKISFSN